MSDDILLVVMSPDTIAVKKQVSYVSLPAVTGMMTVLPFHAPVIAALESGTVEFSSCGSADGIFVKDGIAEFCGNVMTVLAESVSAVG